MPGGRRLVGRAWRLRPGLATAGIGLVVGGLTKMVSKTLDVGRRLGELREKLGVSAEGIQIYERAIEEGNGNTAAFEKTTLQPAKDHRRRRRREQGGSGAV